MFWGRSDPPPLKLEIFLGNSFVWKTLAVYYVWCFLSLIVPSKWEDMTPQNLTSISQKIPRTGDKIRAWSQLHGQRFLVLPDQRSSLSLCSVVGAYILPTNLRRNANFTRR